jgi:hypothetical protein
VRDILVRLKIMELLKSKRNKVKRPKIGTAWRVHREVVVSGNPGATANPAKQSSIVIEGKQSG